MTQNLNIMVHLDIYIRIVSQDIDIIEMIVGGIDINMVECIVIKDHGKLVNKNPL